LSKRTFGKHVKLGTCFQALLNEKLQSTSSSVKMGKAVKRAGKPITNAAFSPSWRFAGLYFISYKMWPDINLFVWTKRH